MSNLTTITLPEFDHSSENFAEVGMGAWIAANGGTDVTGQHGEPDSLGNWIGDVDLDGTVYRLTVVESTKAITAETL